MEYVLMVLYHLKMCLVCWKMTSYWRTSCFYTFFMRQASREAIKRRVLNQFQYSAQHCVPLYHWHEVLWEWNDGSRESEWVSETCRLVVPFLTLPQPKANFLLHYKVVMMYEWFSLKDTQWNQANFVNCVEKQLVTKSFVSPQLRGAILIQTHKHIHQTMFYKFITKDFCLTRENDDFKKVRKTCCVTWFERHADGKFWRNFFQFFFSVTRDGV